MNFQPKTFIYFSKTGIDDVNKVVIKSQEEMKTFIHEPFLLGGMGNCSFQRADGNFTVRVDHNNIKYYKLLQADSLIYLNDDEEGQFYIFCNIIAVEWKNPDCSFVRFKIDYFMTYQSMIDWDKTYALVEREHIKNDWSVSGNPMFSNMGPGEDFGTVADVPFFIKTINFSPDSVVVMSPYNSAAEPVFDGSVKGGLYTSLQIDMLSPSEANAKFQAISEKKTATINNIVGVFGCPTQWARAIRDGGMAYGFGGTGDNHENIPSINIAAKQLPSMIEYNNAKCWSSPFCNIRLMSSEGEVIDITPQWLGNDQNEYTIRYRAGGAGGQFGGAQCTLENKNGAFKWEGWNDFIVSLKELPSCPWTGDGFTDWASRNSLATKANTAAQVNGAISGAFNSVAGAVGAKNPVTGAIGGITGVAEGFMDYISAGANYQATILNQKASGSSVNGVGNFNSLLDIAANNWGFKIVYYATQIYTMLAVDQYFDRFGYRVNKLKKIQIDNRPIWTFVKTLECHVATTTGIPFIAQKAINAMFNAGATFWKLDKYTAGRAIGDFSNAKENRGIVGGG